MANTIYSATGCARCSITKRYMKENHIAYKEVDIKTDGKNEFSRFYRENRADIFRDKDGIEFPVFTDGNVIRQGVSVVIGYLRAENRLQGFIRRSALHGEWLDGIDISGGDPRYTAELIEVLTFLKKNALKIQAVTMGMNSAVLEALLKNNLVDRVIMEVKGPADLYPLLVEGPVAEDDLERSIALTSTAPEYRCFTAIVPVVRASGQIEFITPEEIGAAAQLIEAAGGSKKQPYFLRPVNPAQCEEERFKSLEALPSSAFFKYRSAARRYQVMTEIEK